MFSSRSVQIAAVFSDVFGQALPNLCRSFYNETKAEMFFSVFAVALLAEGVDRNHPAAGKVINRRVALLAEGVDRNRLYCWFSRRSSYVALLAEGVDRNSSIAYLEQCLAQSPSSRRAWIEMSRSSVSTPSLSAVALLAEGVDRNFGRRPAKYHLRVALLAEGVDRNSQLR